MHIAVLDREPLFAFGLRNLILEIEPGAAFADSVCTVNQLNEHIYIRAAFISLPEDTCLGGPLTLLKGLRHDLPVCVILSHYRKPVAPGAESPANFHRTINRHASVAEISESCRQFFKHGVRKKQPQEQGRKSSARAATHSSRCKTYLPPRQIETLSHIVNGKTNPEIARDMGISVNTVRGYVSSVLIALNAANRTQAAIFGQEYFQ
ncbi:MAG: LuxR C-terminal-related transcriptional regulator [Pseudomonadota bacterium]